MTGGTPPAEWDINEAIVRRLLQAQHPDLAGLPISLLDVGWDNAMYHLGDELLVRLPRRNLAVPLIKHEQQWLPELAPRLPIPIPAPVRVGKPSDNYPCRWSIIPWMPGETADGVFLETDTAITFTEFLQALHQPAPESAPVNPVRGVPLAERAEGVEARLTRMQSRTELLPASGWKTLWDLWQEALAIPATSQRCWLHGDLHARNVLVSSGRISGIIDWGDLTAGDPATDLAAVWHLFANPDARRLCLEKYQADSELIARAKGWAINIGVTLLETGLVDHPAHATMGQATLTRLLQGE